MKDELELKLQEDYPFMKQNRVDGERNTYRRWGCECSSGWYNLIHNLCQKITDTYIEYQLPVDIVVLQVKEKFASLRFYYEYEDAPCALQMKQRNTHTIMQRSCKRTFTASWATNYHDFLHSHPDIIIQIL